MYFNSGRQAGSLDIAFGHISNLKGGPDSMTVPKRDWRDLCAAVVNEKDSKNLDFLVQELIQALDDRQKSQSRTQVRECVDRPPRQDRVASP
jgi:hypothetical protein